MLVLNLEARSAGKRPFVRPKPPSYIPEGGGGT